jgi:hypothetical protein
MKDCERTNSLKERQEASSAIFATPREAGTYTKRRLKSAEATPSLKLACLYCLSSLSAPSLSSLSVGSILARSLSSLCAVFLFSMSLCILPILAVRSLGFDLSVGSDVSVSWGHRARRPSLLKTV